MKYTVAIVLVVVALTSAEPPRNGGIFARQQAQQPPYAARETRPTGPVFNLPLRSQRQQQPPVPAASYGPPPQEYGPPPEFTTTEIPTTTETVETTTLESQTESFRITPMNQKLTAPGVQNTASLFVIVPQTQNLMYDAVPLTSAKLVQPTRLVPVQAVPALAKIREVPAVAQYQTVATVPTISSAYTSIVNSPFSYSFVQSFR